MAKRFEVMVEAKKLAKQIKQETGVEVDSTTLAFALLNAYNMGLDRMHEIVREVEASK
jgi:hypothetical protein